MSGERTCSACGASLQEGQDWCLQCGAGAPGSGRMGPGWRSAAVLIGATGALVLGAAAAAYAALDQSSPAKPKTPVVAQTPITTTTTTSSTTTAPPSTAPSPTPAPGAVVKSPSLNTPSTPPKIPGSTATPKSKTTATNTKSSSTTTTSTSTTSSSATEPEDAKQPVAVLLDTNAAQIYNPSNLPASRFGDPSLAIDGDTTTAWTVKLEDDEAPTVGAGLTLDLKAPLKIAQITLITESVGMTVQVYGTRGAKIPQALGSEEWVHLSKAHVVKKRKANITLSEDKKAFRQLLVWIVKAPTSSSGQFTASEVSIDEIQLYEPSSGGSQG